MAIDLSMIKSGRRLRPPKVVLYGQPGIGKTTFAASAPKPIFIMTEEGQGVLDIERFEPHEDDQLCHSWQDILECVGFLYENDHDYQTVVIDTIDAAEPLLWNYTAEKLGVSDIVKLDYGRGYLYALDYARTLFHWLDKLRNKKNMAIILLAHSEVVKFETPDAASYDKYGLRLQKRLAGLTKDWVDALLFANWKAHVVSDDEGFGRDRKRAVGTGERVIYTEERPPWWAKNRYCLPPELPFPREAAWMVFQNAVANAHKTASPPKVKATKGSK